MGSGMGSRTLVLVIFQRPQQSPLNRGPRARKRGKSSESDAETYLGTIEALQLTKNTAEIRV